MLTDRQADDPAAEDVRGLGRMLYAALTAHWPGDEDASGLPAAPAADGVPHAPRQVQAGISHGVDAIVCRCLGIGAAEPLATPPTWPRRCAASRAPRCRCSRGWATRPRVPLPRRPRRPASGTAASATQPHRRPAHEQPAPSHVPPPRVQHGAPPPPPPSTSTRTAPAHGPGAPKRPANRALIGVAAAALTVIVGIGAWALSGTGGDNEPGGGGATDKSKTSAPPQPTVVKLQAQGVQAVQQSRPGHQDTSIGKNTDSVIDGKASGNWETQSYADAGFGNYPRAWASCSTWASR